MSSRPTGEWRFLVFSIRGEHFAQVKNWITQADLAVFRYQFERWGSVRVVRWRGERHFGSVHALPEAGEAEPWYGEIGGAYTYTFRPAEGGGCEVTVRNGAHGHNFFPPEPYPLLHLLAPEPAEFVLTDNPLNVPAYHLETPLRRSAASTDRQVWYDYDDQAAARLMLFRLGPKYLARLAAWPHWGQPLPAYAFSFNLLSVGTAIAVRHLASGEKIDVTEDVDW